MEKFFLLVVCLFGLIYLSLETISIGLDQLTPIFHVQNEKKSINLKKDTRLTMNKN